MRGSGGGGQAATVQREAVGPVQAVRQVVAAGDGDVFGVRPEDGRACPAAPGRVQDGGPVPEMPEPGRAGTDGVRVVPEGGDAAIAGGAGAAGERPERSNRRIKPSCGHYFAKELKGETGDDQDHAESSRFPSSRLALLPARPHLRPYTKTGLCLRVWNLLRRVEEQKHYADHIQDQSNSRSGFSHHGGPGRRRFGLSERAEARRARERRAGADPTII